MLTAAKEAELQRLLKEAAGLFKQSLRRDTPLWYWPYVKFHRRAHIIDPFTWMSCCGKVGPLTSAQVLQVIQSLENPFNVQSCVACQKERTKRR